MSRFILALIVALTAQVAFGQNQMPDKVRKQIDESYIGAWNFTLKSDDGVVKGSFTAKWAPGNHCVSAILQVR